IEALIRIHLPRLISVGRHLPAADVDRLEPGPHLLQRLVPRDRAQRMHIGLGMKQFPEPLRAEFRQRVLDMHSPAQALDIRRTVRAHDSAPARIVIPLICQLGGNETMTIIARHDMYLRKCFLISESYRSPYAIVVRNSGQFSLRVISRNRSRANWNRPPKNRSLPSSCCRFVISSDINCSTRSIVTVRPSTIRAL